MTASPLLRRALLALPLLLAFVLGLFLFDSIGKDPTQLESTLIGERVPAFSAASLRDPDRTLTEADFKGPALINVWATWCPTCRAEHHFLMQLKAQGIPIYGVDYHDQRDAAIQWLEELGDPYRLTAFDPQGLLGIDLGVVAAPETYLIDADGKIIDKLTGELNARTWAPLQAQYQALVGG